MKKISALLIALASLFFYFTIAIADDNKTVFENGDLVVYAPPAPPEEIQRFEKPFDSSVSPGEVPPETALQLLNGEIKEYAPKKNERTEILKILFWHIPLRYEANISNWKFELNEDGKISKIQSSKQETMEAIWLIDFLYRALPIILACLVVFSREERFSTKESISYCIFFIIFIPSVVLMNKSPITDKIIWLIFPLGIGLISALPFRMGLGHLLLVIVVGTSVFGSVALRGVKHSAIFEYTSLIIVTLIISFCARHYRDKKIIKNRKESISTNLPA